MFCSRRVLLLFMVSSTNVDLVICSSTFYFIHLHFFFAQTVLFYFISICFSLKCDVTAKWRESIWYYKEPELKSNSVQFWPPLSLYYLTFGPPACACCTILYKPTLLMLMNWHKSITTVHLGVFSFSRGGGQVFRAQFGDFPAQTPTKPTSCLGNDRFWN